MVRVSEVESLRETNSETYLMSDGTYECVVYAENKYYLDENEVLQPINNAIVAASGGANLLSTQYTNTANAFDVTFSGSGTPEISISYGDAGIAFVPVNATGSGDMHMTASASVIAIGGVENCSTLSQLTATGSNTATYANAFGTADLVYVLENDALKEYIILESSAAPNSFHFLFTLDGVTLQETDTGAAFLNEAGETVFYLGGLFAVDANGVPTDALTYTFQTVKNNTVGVTVTLDPEYLTATDRAFPVVIDPTIMISSSSTADACVCSYTPSTNYQMATQLRTGFCTDYGIRRSLLRFEIPSSIPAGSVTNARFDMEKMSGYAPKVRAMRVIESWSSGTVNFNNQPLYTAVNASNYATQLNGGSWYTMDVTAIVQSWVNETYVNYGFMFKDLYESSSNTNKWTIWYSSDAVSPHKPELYITYSDDVVIPPGPDPEEPVTPPGPDPEIPVTPPDPDPSISLNYSSLNLEIGDTGTLIASVTPSNAAIAWSSSDTGIASVSSTGVVTPVYPGEAIITATISGASAQCAVYVEPEGGNLYTLYVRHYYDKGFKIRHPESEGELAYVQSKVASRLSGIFALEIDPYYSWYTSKAVRCKIERFGSVTADNLGDQGCTHASKCNTTSALRTRFIEDNHIGSSTQTSVLWTGHGMQDPEDDRSVSDRITHTVIITPTSTNLIFTLMHELSHQLNAPDHYCYNPDALIGCLNPDCDTCWNGFNEARQCLMSRSLNIDDYIDSALYCVECRSLIRTHLQDHHD